jgi:anaerobic ribonucleoside-triphosphate reductase activating protein
MECPNSDTWLFSGYTYEMMQGSEILQYVDVLVDGPFLLEEKDISLQFRGSRNQRILRLKGGRPI